MNNTNILLQQLFDTMSPQKTVNDTLKPVSLQSEPVFEDWLVQDVLTDGEPGSSTSDMSGSVHSSPAICTPEEVFLATPPSLHIKQEGKPSLSPPVSKTLDCQKTASPSPVPEALDNMAKHPLTATLAALFTAAAAAGSPLADKTIALPSGFPDSPKSPQMKRKLSKLTSPDPNDGPQDEAALKRQKNTDAARRSRLKKVMKMEALESRVSELEKQNGSLQLRVAVLDSEKSGLLAKESDYERRVKLLEAQLAEAHKALTNHQK